MIDVAVQKSYMERFAAVRSLETDAVLSPSDALTTDIREIGPNGFFEFQGKTYMVKEKNRYEETSDDFKSRKGYFIHELNCLCIDTGDIAHLEWEYDDELEISMTLDRFSFRDLTDDQGEAVDEDDLDQIAEDGDAVIVNGETFWYEDDWASIFMRGKKEEQVYMYEFENKSGNLFLSIEEWQGSGKAQYQIYTSVPVNPGSITIISKGDA